MFAVGQGGGTRFPRAQQGGASRFRPARSVAAGAAPKAQHVNGDLSAVDEDVWKDPSGSRDAAMPIGEGDAGDPGEMT